MRSCERPAHCPSSWRALMKLLSLTRWLMMQKTSNRWYRASSLLTFALSGRHWKLQSSVWHANAGTRGSELQTSLAPRDKRLSDLGAGTTIRHPSFLSCRILTPRFKNDSCLWISPKLYLRRCCNLCRLWATG